MAIALVPTIRNPDIFVRTSNGLRQNGAYFSGFQMVGLLDFRSHFKSWLFTTQPLLHHSKSRLVQISDPHCIQIVEVYPICEWSGFWFVDLIRCITISKPNDLGHVFTFWKPDKSSTVTILIPNTWNPNIQLLRLFFDEFSIVWSRD